MRVLPLLLCLLLAARSGAFAQSRAPQDDDAKALRRARTMIWTGVGLMARAWCWSQPAASATSRGGR